MQIQKKKEGENKKGKPRWKIMIGKEISCEGFKGKKRSEQ